MPICGGWRWFPLHFSLTTKQHAAYPDRLFQVESMAGKQSTVCTNNTVNSTRPINTYLTWLVAAQSAWRRFKTRTAGDDDIKVYCLLLFDYGVIDSSHVSSLSAQLLALMLQTDNCCRDQIKTTDVIHQHPELYCERTSRSTHEDQIYIQWLST